MGTGFTKRVSGTAAGGATKRISGAITASITKRVSGTASGGATSRVDIADPLILEGGEFHLELLHLEDGADYLELE